MYKIVNSKIFETFIMICIIFNIISMAMIYDGMGSDYERIFDIIETIFAFIFVLEAILKLLALGFYRYFSVGWN